MFVHKIFISVLLIFCLMNLGQVSSYGELVSAATQEEILVRTFHNIDQKDYLVFFENAIYSMEDHDMFVVNQWRGWRKAYIYGCDKHGQLKSYVNMDYNKKSLAVEVKVTFDGPEENLKGSLWTICKEILAEVEEYAKLPTVKVVNAVSLREGPDVKTEKILILKPGRLYELLSTEGKWFKVRSLSEPKLEGWVYGPYVRERKVFSAVEEEAVPQQQTEAVKSGTVTEDSKGG